MYRTIEQLREDFRYDPIAGSLFRLNAGNTLGLGLVKPRKTIRHFNEFYPLTHIIWAIHHGVWPKQLIDHRDGDRSNIRINNLREATYQQNQFNKVGVGRYPKGVTKKNDRSRRKFVAVMRINGIKRCLGHFETPEEAGEAYEKAASKYQGEFALHSSMKNEV